MASPQPANFATAATARNVAVDAQTGCLGTYTDGKSSFARSWIPGK